MTTTENKRCVGGAFIKAVGADRPRFPRYFSADESTWIDVAVAADRPEPGWSTCSTMNLHGIPNVLNGYDIRAELIGVCASSVGWFPDLLATAAFCVKDSGWVAAPGHVFPGIVGKYYGLETLPHLFLTDPFEWPELGRLQLPDGSNVHWLLAFPISDSERAYRAEKGEQALSALFEEKGLEYFDLDRAPVI